MPKKEIKAIELFAGAGGLALGLENNGVKSIMYNEIDKWACATLRHNRPEWNVIQEDISKIDFTEYRGKIDLLTGGFPCQAFSYSGKKLGFNDTRGTLLFEYARAIKESQPKMFLAENVKGLKTHDGGRTIQTILDTIDEIGYDLIIVPTVLNSMNYDVPQKRERIFLIGIRKDLNNDNIKFNFPEKTDNIPTVRDAFKKGWLYNSDVPVSEGSLFSENKKMIMDLVPEGGNWNQLPLAVQKSYMKASFFSGGGKTGIARRLSMSEPSLTILCSPSQKQTERCHPQETRPLQVRESARIQTFPDEWEFIGPVGAKYKQVGNAVPVNLATAVIRELVKTLNNLGE